MDLTQITKIASGNFGALRFLMEAVKIDESFLVDVNTTGIVGTDLYVIWNDICNLDTLEAMNLIRTCPLAVLKEAAGRQDYSSANLREQLKAYLKN